MFWVVSTEIKGLGLVLTERFASFSLRCTVHIRVPSSGFTKLLHFSLDTDVEGPVNIYMFVPNCDLWEEDVD